MFVPIYAIVLYSIVRRGNSQCTPIPATLGTYADVYIYIKPVGVGQDSLLYDTPPDTTYKASSTFAEGKWLTTQTANKPECLVELLTIKRSDLFGTDYLQTASATEKTTKTTQAFPSYNQGTLASRWCAKSVGIYNATIPVYRYKYGTDDYLLANPDGSLSATFARPLSGYTQETADKEPICYIWPSDTNQFGGSVATCPTSSTDLTLTDLNIYSNTNDPDIVMTKNIDFQTGVKSIDAHYNLTKTIGKVLLAPETCTCAVPLYTYLRQESLFYGRDSTLSRRALVSSYTKQNAANLTMFCVPNMGACGATLELKAYTSQIQALSLGAEDTYISLSTDRPTTYDAGSTLCYIWA